MQGFFDGFIETLQGEISLFLTGNGISSHKRMCKCPNHIQIVDSNQNRANPIIYIDFFIPCSMQTFKFKIPAFQNNLIFLILYFYDFNIVKLPFFSEYNIQ